MQVNKHQAEKSKGASLELNEINKLSLQFNLLNNTYAHETSQRLVSLYFIYATLLACCTHLSHVNPTRVHFQFLTFKVFSRTTLTSNKGKIFRYLPTEGLGVVLIFKISGRGIMDPDAPIPLDTLTLVPSSRYLVPTLQGFLHKQQLP